MQQFKKIVAGILVYVLILGSLPGGTWTGIAKANTVLKNLKLNTNYYVTGASQYKNKTFILGAKPEGDVKAQLVMKYGTQLKTIIPSSQIEFTPKLVETANKIYIYPLFIDRAVKAPYGFIVDKATTKYEKKSLSQMYSPFFKFAEKNGLQVSTFYDVFAVKDDITWMLLEVYNPKNHQYTAAIVNKNGVGKLLFNEYGSMDVDNNGNMYLGYYSYDNGDYQQKLKKIDLSGKETKITIPSSLGTFPYLAYIDNNNNLYYESEDSIKIAKVKGTSLEVTKSFKGSIPFKDSQKRVWYQKDTTFGYINSALILTPMFTSNSWEGIGNIAAYGSNIFAYNYKYYGQLINTAPDQPIVNTVTDHDRVVKGTAEPGSKITVTSGMSKYYGTTKPDGTFAVTIPVQKAGMNLFVTAANPLVSQAVKAPVIDKTPPALPIVSKVKNGDKVVRGTGEVGATIYVKYGKTTYKNTVKANRTFAVNISTAKAGTTLYVKAADKSGNVSRAVPVVVSK